MKTILIIATIFFLQLSILAAGNNKEASMITNRAVLYTASLLAPVAPAEATFEDVVTLTDIATLAPAAPEEADFSEFAPETAIDITNLSPVTPAEADFK